MKQRYLLVSAAVLAVVAGVFSISNSNGPGGPLVGPLANGNCTNCHSGAVNSGPASVDLTGLPAEYEPGNSYSLTLNTNGSSSSKHGFQVVALDGANNQAGALTAGSGMDEINAQGVIYLEHNTPSTSGSWQFDWTAPQAGTGTVTFYAIVNATNSNGTSSGDNVYEVSFSADEQDAANVTDVSRPGLTVFPNPSTDYIMLSGMDGLQEIQIINLSGQMVKTGWIQKGSSINTKDLERGTYFLKMVESNRILKFVKQ